MFARSKGSLADYGGAGNLKVSHQYRELYPSLLTIGLFAIFGSATVTGVRLALEPSSKYWVGQSGFAVLVIPVIVIISHICQSYYRRPLYLAVVASCAVPPLISLITGFIYMAPVTAAASRLLSSDCTTFRSKFHIEQAYRTANDFYQNCLTQEAHNRSTTVDAVRAGIVISQCPGYDPTAAGYQEEWMYLQSLEEQYDCSGWCFDGEAALWTHNPTSWDSCSAAAGMTMKNKIARNANRMMVNGIIGFVIAFAAIFAINEWMARSDDPSFHW